MSQGSWGGWKCVIESDNGKGDFSEIKVGNEKGIYLDRIVLLEMALAKLGINVEYTVDGVIVK